MNHPSDPQRAPQINATLGDVLGLRRISAGFPSQMQLRPVSSGANGTHVGAVEAGISGRGLRET
jgi:hypothetical protein